MDDSIFAVGEGEGPITLAVNINGTDTRGIVDSGASRCVMDLGTMEVLGGNTSQIGESNSHLVDASNNEMPISGIWVAKTYIPRLKKTMSQAFYILNERTYKTLLLGRDFFSKTGPVTMDFIQNRIKIEDEWIKGISPTKKLRVNTTETVVIPPRSETIMSVRSKNQSALLGYEFYPDFGATSGIYFANALVQPDQNGCFNISVLNVNDHEVTLKSRTRIGDIKPCGTDSVVINTVTDNPTDKVKFGKQLTEKQKRQMREVVEKHNGVFASNPKKPKITNVLEHDINTGDARPTYVKPRRTPHIWKKEIDDIVQEMYDNGIIRKSKSPWNCPTILVKKHGKTRFVCDFRDLNKVTKADTYPLPNIKDCIENMEGAKFWTTLDAASAYWAVNLKEEDREKTAFSVPNGKFEFNVMAFGLRNAGPTYQRMIDICLSGLPTDRLAAYLDDIVIFSKSWEEHISDVDMVLRRFSEANISLRPDKCVFGSDEIDFLGYHINENGITPRKELVDSIIDFKQPKSKKEIKRFLGTVGFYHNFIEKFSDISYPLRHLTKDEVPFEWTPACSEAFELLKNRISTKPILAFPITNKPIIVEVDASGEAIGGVLTQEQQDGTIKPVAYYSCAMSKQEQKWDTFSKEAYALVVALRKWHTYLYGNKFTVKSDHNPLKTMRDRKDPRGKTARWLMEMSEYDFDIEYIKGVDNTKADFLSRGTPTATPPAGRIEEFIYTTDVLAQKEQFLATDNFRTQLLEEQDADMIIKTAKQELRENNTISKGRLKRVRKQLRIVDNILTKSGRPVIPSSMYGYIANEFHTLGNVEAHCGLDKTYELMKSRVYWPNMYGFLKNYIASCDTCQRCKALQMQPKAPLVSIVVPTQPVDFICMDIAYLEEDPDGYRYILLIGCVFSKFIMAVPLKEQTADVIVDAVYKKWICLHGSPRYLLSDKGSNVDGETVNEVCKKLHIEKRRTSGYHAQGNGFAERSIRNVREILRTALLSKKLPQIFWRSILNSLVFAINATVSKSTQCAPYEIVFGRKPQLPLDSYLDLRKEFINDSSQLEYLKDIKVQLMEIIDQVAKALDISRATMCKQYNKHLKVNNYLPNDKVWLQRKTFQLTENEKLSPRRSGPWTIVKILPNKVNFKIREDGTGKMMVITITIV